MMRYALRRLAGGLAVLFVVSIVVFALLHLAPGDPASVLAGPDASAKTVAVIRHQLGLDEPMVQQYLDWLGELCTGDLGESYTLHEPVAELISQRLGSTLQLTVAAGIIMIVLGTVLGVVMATSRSAVLKQVSNAVATVSLALPPFVSGVILIFVFAVVMGVLPSGGDAPLLLEPASSLRHLILPSVAIALPGVPVIARLLATQMRQSRDQEFILTALAKGASPRRITWRHVVPNSLGAAIIEVGIRIGHLLGGAIVAEAIFARAGLGSLLIEAVQGRDYRLAQVLLLLAIAVAILAQVLAEICIARIDPRIKLGGRA